ncbi:MAG: histidine phosphatase family protein [Ktedonobacterales bacterium]
MRCARRDSDSALTPLGEAQARAVGERLADVDITHIVSSPLARALATACIIGSVCDKPIDIWIDACEIWQDAYRGAARHELMARFPTATLPPDVTDEGWEHSGDTEDSLHARCERVVQRLADQFDDTDRVAFVTHGGFANHLLHSLLHIPAHQRLWFHMENGAISALRFIPEKERQSWPLYPAYAVEVRALNDTSYLGANHGE